MAFKRCSISTKGPKVCQENIPHTITPPPPAWTVETRHDGSMLSCTLRQILTLSKCRSINWDSSDQATFFQSSLVQFWWACWSIGIFTHNNLFTQMASTVTRSQFNRALLGCGETGDLHHEYAADKSAATVWCYRVNMDQNLWGMFPTHCWIYATKN